MQDHGFLMIPPLDVPKNSDAWLGHLQRRHIFRGRLNTAASHPRLREMNAEPFILLATRGGYEVCSPQLAAVRAKVPSKIASLVGTKRKQLAYLLQSADWDNLPPHERAVAETIYDDIEQFSIETVSRADFISKKLGKLEHRLRTAVDAGSLRPRNGGLKQLLSPDTPDDDLINSP